MQIDKKVLICGVCRDVESRLPYSILIAEEIGSLFQDYRVVLYENNSKDKTTDIMDNWTSRNPKVNVRHGDLLSNSVIINRLENGDPYRPELIAIARNIVLLSTTYSKYDDYSHVIWMDFDFKLDPTYDGFFDIFKNDHWDAQFAYGVDPVGNYWDWYAHRCNKHPYGPEFIGHSEYYRKKENLVLTKNDDLYSVFSAFGGCGVYNRDAITGIFYSAIVNSDLALLYKELMLYHPRTRKAANIDIDIRNVNKLTFEDSIRVKEAPEINWRCSSFVYNYPSVCEHVTFHASMIKAGYDRLFINPKLKFTYGG